MKGIWIYILAIACFVSVTALTIHHRINYPDKINEWAKKENLQVTNVDIPWFETGPYSFWTSKHTTIYKVETNKGVYWIRFYNISSDIQDVEKE